MNQLKPFKSLTVESNSVKGISYWPEAISDNDPWWEGGSSPRHYKWEVSFSLTLPQSHSYPLSSTPFQYTLNDINVNDFMISGVSGKVYRVSEVKSKTELDMVCILEDVYRNMMFKYPQGLSQPESSTYFLCFNVNDVYETSIDPYQISSNISPNSITYIPSYLKQISFLRNPIFKCECDFNNGDIIAIEKGVGFTKPTGSLSKKVVGKVVGSTGIYREYIVEPITSHEEIPQTLGVPGDVLYLGDDGVTLTLDPTQKPMYLKTYDAIPNIARANSDIPSPIINSNTVIEINGERLEFVNETTMGEFVTIINGMDNGIESSEILPEFIIENDISRLSFGIVGVTTIPTTIEINGHPVVIQTTTAGQAEYGSEVAISADILFDINQSNIPDIVASYDNSTGRLTLTNTDGGDIIIENISGDTFASDIGDSATGFNETNISPKDKTIVEMVVENGDEIVIRQIEGNFTSSSGISGADNGRRAMGIYYGGKVREGTNYVIDNMSQLDDLSPFIGDGVHVLDSGNGEWNELKYTTSGWVIIATEDSARTDADTLSITIVPEDKGQIYIGTVSANSRISNITIVVTEAFNDDSMTINVGDATTPDVLFNDSFIDLMTTGTYTNTPSNVYTTETDIFAVISNHTSLIGELKIIISYM